MKWVISVAGYGAFLYEGSETEAEEMRVHKARWERGVGIKRLATDDEASGGPISRCINHEGFGHKFVYNNCRCPDMDCVADAHERLTQPAPSSGEQP